MSEQDDGFQIHVPTHVLQKIMRDSWELKRVIDGAFTEAVKSMRPLIDNTVTAAMRQAIEDPAFQESLVADVRAAFVEALKKKVGAQVAATPTKHVRMLFDLMKEPVVDDG